MKLKVNWKELGKQLWAAVKPVLLAAIGGGLLVADTDEQISDALGCRNRNSGHRGRVEFVARGGRFGW